jgi:hypothetical protein
MKLSSADPPLERFDGDSWTRRQSSFLSSVPLQDRIQLKFPVDIANCFVVCYEFWGSLWMGSPAAADY